MRRLKVSLKNESILRASRVAIGNQRLVYLLVANRQIRYSRGRSKVVYVGTTKKGLSRVASSVASRADDILWNHGIREFHARIVTCRPRQKVKTWLKLERAFLVRFKELFGEVPMCNTKGSKMKPRDVFEYFTMSAIDRILRDIA
jgi:hypothetical protein